MPDGSTYRPLTTDEEWNEQYENARGIRNVRVETKTPKTQWYQAPTEGYRDYRRISGKSKFRRRGLMSAIRKKKRIGHGPLGAVGSAAAKVRAVAATITICLFGGWLYLGQLLFWVLSISALTLEASWLGFVIPGKDAFYATWALTAFFGCASLVFGLGVYAVYRVNTLQRGNMMLFGLCLILYLTPLMNFLPWGILWALGVIHNAGKK